MTCDQGRTPAKEMFVIALIILNVVIIKAAFVGSDKWYGLLYLTIPLLLLAIIYDSLRRMVSMWQKKVKWLFKLGELNISKFKTYSSKPQLSSQVVKSDGRIHHKLE